MKDTRSKEHIENINKYLMLAPLLSRGDIAHLSNMTTSNAIRTLAVFVSEGLIQVKGRKLRIANLPGLEAISESGQ